MDINQLANEIRNKALAKFIEQAANAFVELERDIGALPEEISVKWNDALQAILESQA